MAPAPPITLPHWLRSSLFRSYVRNFLLLWLAFKIANAFIAGYVGVPPLGFRLGTEIAGCAIELIVLVAFIRRGAEDILLANLGWPLAAALAPLVPLHFGLSLALSLLA